MVLKLIRQRDGTTFSGSNCGCVATAHALAWSTGNKVRRTPDQCRKALGGVWVGPGGATALRDQARGWETFRRAARRRGLKLSAFEICATTPWGRVIKALKAGDAVMLQIDNKTLNDEARALSGFPGFDGLHVVLLTDLRRRPDGTLELLDYDGGYDGRIDSKTGTRVPRGPQWVPEAVLMAAAERKNVISLCAGGMEKDAAKAMAKGTATFAIIAPATPIKDKVEPQADHDPDADPDPDPGPVNDVDDVTPAVVVVDPGLADDLQDDIPDPEVATVAELRAALTRLKRRLAQAHTENERLLDENATLENALGIIQTLLARAQPGDQAVTDAAAEIDRALPPPPPGDDALDIGVGDEL